MVYDYNTYDNRYYLPISNDLGRKVFGNSFHIKGHKMNQYIGKNSVNTTGTNNVGSTCQSST